MNNCLNCERYYSLPFTTKAQQYLLNLITRHQQFAKIQRIYTLQETQEQEFLDQSATKLIGGLLGETKYSQLKGVTA